MISIVMATDTDFWFEDRGSHVRIAAMYRYLASQSENTHIYYTRILKPADKDAIAERFPGMHIHTAPPEDAPPGPASLQRKLSGLLGRLARRMGLRSSVSAPKPAATAPTKKPVQHHDRKLGDFRSEHHIKHFRAVCEEVGVELVIIQFIRLAYLLDAFVHYTKRRPVTAIDTIDVMHLRAARFHQRNEPHWVDISREEEREVLDRFDYILAIQSDDALIFKEMLPDKPTVVAGHAVSIRDNPIPKNDIVQIAYVASAAIPNQHAIRAFLDEIWPTVYAAHSDEARLNIAGSICDALGDASLPEGATVIGYVDDLDALYAETDIVVNPVTFGGGLKIKCVEALAHGKPLITSPVGAEGIEKGANKAFIVCTSPAETAEQLNALIENPERRLELATSGRAFAKQHFSVQAAYGPLGQIIESIAQSR